MFGKRQGKTNFTIAPINIFDIILGKEFFQRCHMMFDPYLPRLLVMEQEGSFMVPLVKVPKNEIHAHLSAMQIMKVLTFLDTIATLGE